MADKMSIDKKDSIKEDSEESPGSSPEAEQGQTNNALENQQPKRKGGRKPIYATSEERKQRNRQAQAAFRERRTEYIKQLEETIRVHEQNLHQLQSAHRNAADECLMLRYKNSLLERILLEKGIDVQAELHAKTGSPNFGPTHVPQNLVQPPPLPRALLNRHHARRSASSIAPKIEPGLANLPPPLHTNHPPAPSSIASPKNRPTPSSHSASPSATTSAFGASPATTSGSEHVSAASMRPAVPATAAAMKAQTPTGMVVMPGLTTATGAPRTMQQQLQAMRGAAGAGATPAVSGSPYFHPPAFQNHMEQLEQEYDAADMLDDGGEPPGTPSGPGPYPGGAYTAEPQPMSLSSPTTTGPSSIASVLGHSHHPGIPTMTQLLDTNPEWDPFGLSASMQFPTQFAFDTSNMR